MDEQRQSLPTHLREIVDASGAGAWEWNIETDDCQFSDRWAEIFGFNAADLEPTFASYQRLLHPDDREGARAALEEFLASGQQHYRHHERMQHRDGHWIWVQQRALLMPPTAAGGPRLLVGVTLDESESRAVQEQLRRASIYARNLLEASVDPLVTIGVDGRIMDVNKATEAATGRSREDIIGTDFSDYFTEPAKAREGYQQVFTMGRVIDYPLTLQHTSGSRMDVLYNASTYHDEDGRVAGVFAAARNVTETRRTQRELEATTHEVTLLSQMSDLLQSCQPSTRRCPSCGRACSSCSPVRAAGSWSSTLRTINSMRL